MQLTINPNSSAADLDTISQQLAQKYPDDIILSNLPQLTAPDISTRDPSYKTSEMISKITENSRNNIDYLDTQSMHDNIIAINKLTEQDINRSSQLLPALNNFSLEAIDLNKNPTPDSINLNNAIIATYSKVKYTFPKHMKTALSNIDQLDTDNSALKIDAIEHIYQHNTTHSPDVAQAAYNTLNNITPRSYDETIKMQSIYQQILSDNPNLVDPNSQDFNLDKMLNKYKESSVATQEPTIDEMYNRYSKQQTKEIYKQYKDFDYEK